MTTWRRAPSVLTTPHLLAVLSILGGPACFPTYEVSPLDGSADTRLDAADGAATACNGRASTEDCYSCCATLDGGDLAFFQGDLHTCACAASTCLGDCPLYCQPGAPADKTDCDLCVYLTMFGSRGTCASAATTASQTSAGAGDIYRCLQTCQAPSDPECQGLSTLRGCYDCCEGKHWSATTQLFGAAGRACVCDGGCASACPQYCPTGAIDQPACTECGLHSLVDGGCAATGATQCSASGPECTALVACMQLCAQTQ